MHEQATVTNAKTCALMGAVAATRASRSLSVEARPTSALLRGPAACRMRIYEDPLLQHARHPASRQGPQRERSREVDTCMPRERPDPCREEAAGAVVGVSCQMRTPPRTRRGMLLDMLPRRWEASLRRARVGRGRFGGVAPAAVAKHTLTRQRIDGTPSLHVHSSSAAATAWSRCTFRLTSSKPRGFHARSRRLRASTRRLMCDTRFAGRHPLRAHHATR